MKLNCIITDDEPIAREIIAEYVKMISELNLVAICTNAAETFSALNKFKVDLLFIDIQMPEISGLDLVRSLTKIPYVIFTTAHTTFAVDCFELDAVDYLLKPISKERFLKAISKVFVRYRGAKQILSDSQKNTVKNKFFFAKTDSGLVRIDYDTILYIEGLENYIKIVCENKTVVLLSTMKSIERSLSQTNFLRIHRSYIVNMDKVESVKDFCFNIKTYSLQVGKSYKKKVLNIIKEMYFQKPEP